MRHANSKVHTLGEPAVLDSAIRNLIPINRHAQATLETVQREIAGCTLCVAAGFIPRSLPIFHGHAEQRLMIVGQAPGPSAGERPLPYTGATGKTLQRWLERAGIPPEASHRDSSDQPHQMLPGSGDRNRGEGGSPAVRQGDRALRAASRPGDRAGAA